MKAINQALDHYCERHPHLIELRNRLSRDAKMTRTWAAEYANAEIPSEHKSLLLRCLFGDPTLAVDYDVMSHTCLHNGLTYLLFSPSTDLDWHAPDYASSKYTVPKALSRMTGIPPKRPFLFLQSYVKWIRKNATSTVISKLAVLLELAEDKARLDSAILQKWFSSDTKRLKQGIGYFFDSEVSVHADHNVLMFLTAFRSQDRNNGRIQNKIPIELSVKLGIPRLSLVALEVAMDIMALIANNLIQSGDSSNRVEAYARHLLQSLSVDSLPDWLNSPGFLLTRDSAEALYLGYQERSQGTFATGYYFNLTRLLAKQDTFTSFSSSYDRIDHDALESRILDYYKATSPQFAVTLGKFFSLNKDEYPGIHLRDIANVLFYIYALKSKGLIDTDQIQHYSKSLPTTARYTAGQPEYIPNSQTNTRHPSKAGASDSSSQRYVDLPVIDRFLEMTQEVVMSSVCQSVAVQHPDIDADVVSRIVESTIEALGRVSPS